jgi:hypothetical protein
MQVRILDISRNGKRYRYAQLVESYRRESDGMPMHRIIRNLGPADSVEVHNLREALAAARMGKRVAVSRGSGSSGRRLPRILANLRYLDAAVLLALWDEWQLTELFDELLPRGSADVAPASVLAALVMQRALDPGSKLYAIRWFPTSAMPELLQVAPVAFNNSRVHRVLDELDSVGSALMGKLPARYQHRDGAFVSLFLDATDTWFVGHGPELAERAKTKEGRVERKIGIVLLCNEHGYPLRWEVIAGRESEVTAMSRMLALVAGLSWAQKVPLVCDRAMGRTAQVRQMLSAGMHFVTALTTAEYDAYTDRIPYNALAGLELHDDSGEQDRDKAARLVEAAGLQRIDDRLFVADLGIVQRVDEAHAQQAPAAAQDDAMAGVMQLARSIDDAVAAGRYASQASAGRALGLSKQLASRYRLLRRLPECLQQQILDGKARGRSLKELIRIARMGDAQSQCEAFATLIATRAPRRASARPLGVSTSAASSTCIANAPAPEPIRVRAVVYFNPQLFVEHRRRARAMVESVAAFANELNTRLASPRSRMTHDQIAATIDRRLRRDDLLEAFVPQITQRQLAGRNHFEVKLQIDESEWSRRRRYDGFNVVVAHPDVQHTAPELAQLYRAKDAVEKDFQVIKSLVELRPVRHQTDSKVRAHVTICMLALLLERTLHQKLQGKYSTEAALGALEGCRLNRLAANGDGTAAYALTELTPEQNAILRLLRMRHLGDQEQVAARIMAR